ncbi:MAG: hypothetical protein KA387_04585 [Rubrivivax sp.]|nr:hypothetical protein [Rubrivivax sp.]
MTAGIVADLLADLLAPAANAVPEGTPAKAANPANREQWRGLPADSQPANGLRISANPEPHAAEAAPDSQTFAEIRNPQNGPDRKQRRGFSQDSQDSQGADSGRASAAPGRLIARASAAPVMLARPRPAGAAPAELPAPAARAWPKAADSRPYRLAQAAGDAAHAEPWNDGAIARFQARVAAFRRRGFTEHDADDLAERSHLLDVQAEGRALCLTCRHLAGAVATGWRCGNHRAAGVARDLAPELVTLAQRCPGFKTA